MENKSNSKFITDKLSFRPDRENSRSDRRNFRSRKDEILIPLLLPTRNNPGKAIKITLSNVKEVRKHLLWNLIFKGITVLEWFILEFLLESYIFQGTASACTCFAGVLYQSGRTRKGVPGWSTRLRPIYRQLQFPVKLESQEILLDFLQFVVSELGLPNKGMDPTYLYNHQIVSYQYRNPKEVSRMGVGYKDKGSMTPPHELKFEVESGQEWTPGHNDRLLSVLKNWKEIFSKKIVPSSLLQLDHGSQNPSEEIQRQGSKSKIRNLLENLVILQGE